MADHHELFQQLFGSSSGSSLLSDPSLLDLYALSTGGGDGNGNGAHDISVDSHADDLYATHTREGSSSSTSSGDDADRRRSSSSHAAATGTANAAQPGVSSDLARSATSSSRSGIPMRPSMSRDKSSTSTSTSTTTTVGAGKKQKKAAEQQDDEGGDAGSTGKKAKKTRNRKPSSCAQCRKKKLRCNRADPCAPCVSRGEGHLCSWEGAEPLYKARDEADTQDLRDQVARLESLVRYLTSQRPDDSSGDFGAGLDGSCSPEPSAVDNFPSKARGFDPASRQPFHHGHGGDGSGGSGSNSGNPSRGSSFGAHDAPAMQHPTPKSALAIDMRANDLAEGLAQLAIKEFVVLENSGLDAWAPGNARGLEFLSEAKEFVETMPQHFGVSQKPAFALPADLTPRSTGTSPAQQLPSFAARMSSGLPAMSAHSGASAASEAASSPAPSSYAAPSPLSPGGLSTAAFTKDAPPLSEAIKYLPTYKQAMSAYRYFSGYVSWYAHPVHLATFEQQWADLRAALEIDNEDDRDRAIDPFFIATFLGVLATGLAMMPVKRAIRDGFGTDKDKIVDSWLEGAMVALTCGRFLDNPSVEAVRATVVLGTFFVFVATGERSGAGMGLLSLVVQIALSLGLHRDPDRSPGKFTFFEAEERRRLFWNLFMLCILSSASLSRTWAVFDLNGVDTKLPLDCTDDEILDEAAAMAGLEKRKMRFEETPMTSLIVKMKLAVLARKMNDRAFGIHPVQYEEILALDAELREFEDAIPSRYQLRLDPSGALSRPTAHVTVTEMRACMVQISLAGEFLRVHRPWMLLAGSDKRYQYSRNQAIKYAKLLLAVYRSPSCNGQKWGGLSYKATNAAIVLAVDILAHPDGSEVSQLRSMVRAVCKQMEVQASVSSLCRKGVRVLKFLLDKEALLSSQRDQRRLNKRVRTDEAAGVSFPSRQLRTALDPTFAAASPLQFMHDRDDDQALLHKSTHGASPTEYFAASAPPNAHAFRPPPLPLPRQPRAAPPPPPGPAPPPSSVAIDAPSFVDLGTSFEFDFQLPPPPPSLSYASPASTVYSYPSPYPHPHPHSHPPHYGQAAHPPVYTSQPPTPALSTAHNGAATYAPAPLDYKTGSYASPESVVPSATYVLPRY
ncbi:hypothetical protein JCM3775_001696 [Rhodotorula graminis]